MENLTIYNAVRTVPQEAQKKITGGRLSGKTDINPMWRIKVLTEQFGPCGFGWKYEITNMRLERGSGEEVAAFVDINLYVKYEGEWSEPIPGTGGNMFVAKEKNGLYMSDECYKMALTDALSVACKALGVGADVYWQADKTKYEQKEQAPARQPKATNPIIAAAKAANLTSEQLNEIVRYKFQKPAKELTTTDKQALLAFLKKVASGEEKWPPVIKMNN